MGAILTGAEIKQAYHNGDIRISRFDPMRVGPNSYDLTCGDVYMTYDVQRGEVIDPEKLSTYPVTTHKMDQYTILLPGDMILISSAEKIGTNKYVPMITGRSSVGRLGLSVHNEAGFGDIGFHGHWTFQLTTIYPIMIRPGMRIAQCYFLTIEGANDILYHGRYNNGNGPIASRFGISQE